MYCPASHADPAAIRQATAAGIAHSCRCDSIALETDNLTSSSSVHSVPARSTDISPAFRAQEP